MNPLFKALLLSWEWRPEVFAVLALFGALFSIGWWRLRRRGQQRLASVPRLALYWNGLIILTLALVSPIDVMGGQLFTMHMVQHLLLVMFAPPLLLLANPFPFVLWGLPSRVRSVAAQLFYRRSTFRYGVRYLTRPIVAWSLHVFFLISWHDPNLYNLSLRSDWVHDLQHLTFFVSAMLYWWHIIGAAPRIHRRFTTPARIVYLLAAVPPNAITGAVIAFASTPIYTYYATVPRIFGMSVIDDQAIAGTLMWIVGSMMYILAVVVLLGILLNKDEKERLTVRKKAQAEATENSLIGKTG